MSSEERRPWHLYIHKLREHCPWCFLWVTHMQAAFTTQLYVYIRIVVSWSGYKQKKEFNKKNCYRDQVHLFGMWILEAAIKGVCPIRANVPLWTLKCAYKQWKLQKLGTLGNQIGYLLLYWDSAPKWCRLWVPESQRPWQHVLTTKETPAPVLGAMVHPSAGLHGVANLLENLVSIPGLLRWAEICNCLIRVDRLLQISRHHN